MLTVAETNFDLDEKTLKETFKPFINCILVEGVILSPPPPLAAHPEDIEKTLMSIFAGLEFNFVLYA